jgi:hypothetical protein
MSIRIISSGSTSGFETCTGLQGLLLLLVLLQLTPARHGIEGASLSRDDPAIELIRRFFCRIRKQRENCASSSVTAWAQPAQTGTTDFMVNKRSDQVECAVLSVAASLAFGDCNDPVAVEG